MDMIFDVCVIGGGPAGSTIATMLCKFGYKVVLIEKEAFPRPNIGLSLTPGIHHFLDLLNVREEVEKAGFIKSIRAIVSWGQKEPFEKENDDGKYGYHVDRGIFDQILLNNAMTHGVKLYQPYTCKKVKCDKDDNLKIVLKGNNSKIVSARFIVEATGNSSVLPSKKIQYLAKSVACYAYWNIPGVKDETAYIEAGSNHWYWGAPCSKDTFAVCVFSDPKDLKINSISVEEFYLKKLKESKYLNFCLGGKIRGKINVCATTGFYDDNPVGHNHIKVGNASFSVDPLSSQGVQKAIMSAYQGSIVVNTILSCKHEAKDAIEFYQCMQKNTVEQHKKWTQDFYFQHKEYKENPFWVARSKQINDTYYSEIPKVVLDNKDKLGINSKAEFKLVAVINGDFIERKEGIIIPGTDEPVVFLCNKHVPELVRVLNNLTVNESRKHITSFFADNNPDRILNWLVSKQIMNKTNV
ncbi:MAG: NAD(P)/FAD-dependent oxidoreductase [Planctomycetes bacterium]|nr:NAD(P)/FAD-dependent oxidoreductase [Planctomycetota bacterium]